MNTRELMTCLTLPILSMTLMAAACGGSAQREESPPPAEEAALSPSPAQLAGTWKSGCMDPGNGQGIDLTFRLTESRWELDYNGFGDAACTVPFLTVAITGPYELKGASSVVEGMRDGEFGFGTRTVTPHMEAAVGFLGDACGGGTFAEGTATTIIDGCAGLGAYPASSCPTDYDIVGLEDGKLIFGARPADNNMCSADKRPTMRGLVLTKS